MTRCPHCGQERPEESAVCPFCGAETAAPEEPGPVAEESAAEKAPHRETGLWARLRNREKAPGNVEKRKRILRVLGWSLTAAGLLTLLGVALALMLISRQTRGAGSAGGSAPLPAKPGTINFYTQVDPAQIRADGPVLFVQNELIAVSAEGLPYTEMERFCSQRGIRVVGYVELTDTYQLRLPEVHTLAGLERIAGELEQESQVDCAMANVVWQPGFASVPDDPWGGRLSWEEAAPGTDNWGLAAIHAPESWERYAPSTVRIGLMDGAFDSRHEDIRFAVLRYNSEEKRYEQTDSVSPREHGTMLASVLGATPGNGLGLCGVVKDCALYAYACPAYCGQMDGLSAVAELAGQGVNVITCGMGYREELVAGAVEGESAIRSFYYEKPARTTALALNRLLEKGYDFLLVVPTGNGVEGAAVEASWSGLYAWLSDPQLHDRVLVTGAAGLDRDGELYQAPFSNTGARVDVLAPGVQVYCALPEDSYALRDGSSLAAAQAGGVCAAVWAMNPDLSGAQVRELVVKSAKTPVPGGDASLIDMRAAMEQAVRGTGENPGRDEQERALDAYGALLARGVELQLRRLPGESSGLSMPAQYYVLLDMDADGVDEILLYALNAGERSASFAIYGYRSGEAIRLADAWNTCRFSSWANAALTLEVYAGRYVCASAEKSSTGYGETGELFWLRYDGSRVLCDGQDRRQEDGQRTVLISDSALTEAGIRIGSAEDPLRDR